MNALRLSKKAFTWGVVATTIAWSVGIAALPLSASAALPATGSLVKASLSTVYYYASNGKRYVFPNEKAYKTWYPDFGTVVTISDADLASISIGGNVTYRSGTRLIKINTDPKTYAVEPGGKLRWIASEAVAKALWGNSWATRVDDVADSYWSNYTSASDLNSNVYTSGSLVKASGSADVYYVDGTSKRKVTAAGFTANNFRSEFVVTTTLDLGTYTAGTDISVNEPVLSDVAQVATGGGTPSSTGTSLTVAAASDSPVGVTVVSDTTSTYSQQALIGVMKLHFTAPADGDVVVKGLKFSRSGISADADFQDVYLYDGDGFGTLLAKANSIASGKVIFSVDAGLFTVPKGGSKDIYVRADMATNVSSGKTFAFALAAADVTPVSSGTTVSGSVTSGTFTVAAVADLGRLEIKNVNPTAATTVDPQDNYEAWRFQVKGVDQTMLLKSLKITNAGSIGASDLQNFKLMDSATQLGATAASMTSNVLTFDFTSMADGGLKLTSGQSKQLSLRADIKAGTNRTFRFSVRNSTDVVVYDTNYNVYVRPVKGDSGTSFSVVEPASGSTTYDTTISTGKLTIQRASDSPSTNVPDGATNVLLAKWNYTAAGEDVKVNSHSLTCGSGDGTTIVKNIKLLFDGAQVGTTATTLTCDGSTAAAYTFGNSFIVPAGSTKTLAAYADLTDDTSATNDTLTVNLAAPASANAEGRVSLTAITTTASSGNTVTVKSGAVTTSEDASFADRTASNPTGVLGALGVNIGQFIVTGGGEDADISQMVLTDNVTTNTLADTFQNLKLWVQDGTTWTQVGQTFGSLTDTAATTYTFSPATAIRVLAGGSKAFKITADVKTGGTVITADGVIYPSQVSATGVTTGTDVSDSNGTNGELQNVWIVTNGNLQIYPDSATPVHSTQVMGATGIELGRFTFKADQNEDINVTKLVIADFISNMGGAGASSGTLKNLKIVNAVTNAQYGGTVASLDSSAATGSTVAPVAVFDNISNLVVPRNGTVAIKMMGDIATYSDGAISSSTHRVAIMPNYTGIGDVSSTPNTARSVVATGKDSGFQITGCYLDFNSTSAEALADVNVTANYIDVFRTKITLAKAADAPSGLSSGASEQTVAKFVVTNVANVDSQTATLNLMNLDIGTTISSTHARASTDIRLYKDSVITGNQIASSNGCATVISVCNYSSTEWTDAQVTDEDISAGASRTYIVTMYTSDAAAQKTLTVGLNNLDILWTDGVTSGITMVDSIPVSGNTLSY